MSPKSNKYVPALGHAPLTRFYDIVVGLTTRENTFKSALIAQASIKPGTEILDVACGTAIFFFAFLPQFVSPEHGPLAMQIIVLGIIFVVLAILSDGLYALVAGSAREFITGNLLIARFQKYVAGFIYITLGLTTALSGNSKNK